MLSDRGASSWMCRGRSIVGEQEEQCRGSKVRMSVDHSEDGRRLAWSGVAGEDK